MLEKMKNYIHDKEFYFTVYEDRVYFVNFKRIILLEDQYVSLQGDYQKITVSGNHLVLSKLLEKEMLITGNIVKIEVSNV